MGHFSFFVKFSLIFFFFFENIYGGLKIAILANLDN